MGARKTPTKPTEKNVVTKKGPSKPVIKRVRRKKETFSSYIYKVLKQVHQDTKISKTSMAVMNSFIFDLFEQISLEASKLVRNSKKHTLSSREIKSSVKLILPGELARHAIIEGSKALNKYNRSS